ncbi:hypothetical protein A2U01_0097425, partial [Trifolium medium]|nr:hypothetical protein [Trifolium medium]
VSGCRFKRRDKSTATDDAGEDVGGEDDL